MSRKTEAERYKGLSKGIVDTIETQRTRRVALISDAAKTIFQWGSPGAAAGASIVIFDAEAINVIIAVLAIVAVIVAVGNGVRNAYQKRKLRKTITGLEEDNRDLRHRLGYPPTGPLPELPA